MPSESRWSIFPDPIRNFLQEFGFVLPMGKLPAGEFQRILETQIEELVANFMADVRRFAVIRREDDTTPSETRSDDTILDQKIGKFLEILGLMLLISDLPSKDIERVLNPQGPEAVELVNKFRADVYKRVQIRRKITVDRLYDNPLQFLEHSGRCAHIDKSLIANMPRGEGNEVEVIFFYPGRDVNDDDLDVEYDSRGLIPCDPISLAQVNRDDPNLSGDFKNGTHWKDNEGNWCYAIFDTEYFRQADYHETHVNVARNISGMRWSSGWWLAGVRKPV